MSLLNNKRGTLNRYTKVRIQCPRRPGTSRQFESRSNHTIPHTTMIPSHLKVGHKPSLVGLVGESQGVDLYQMGLEHIRHKGK